MSSLTHRAASRAIFRARLAPWLSWIAGGVGLFLVGLFLYQAGQFATLFPSDMPATLPVIENPDQATTYEPRLRGVDRNSQPYVVRAKRGWQDTGNDDLAHMETVVATFNNAAGSPYDVTSGSARYNSKLKELDLADQVTIVQKSRFTARMAKAHVMVEDKIITSDVPVDVEFGDSTIRANGMKITNDGGNILFFNGVKARFAGAPATGETAQ